LHVELWKNVTCVRVDVASIVWQAKWVSGARLAIK
jgi:hypothetical protein